MTEPQTQDVSVCTTAKPYPHDRWRIWSRNLNQNIYVTEVSPIEYTVYTADGVLYRQSELRLLHRAGDCPKSVHIVKKLFGGTVWDFTPRQGR